MCSACITLCMRPPSQQENLLLHTSTIKRHLAQGVWERFYSVKKASQAAAHIDLVSCPDSCGGNGLCLVYLGGEGLHRQAPVPIHGPLTHGLIAQGARQGSKAGHLGHACPGLQAHHTGLPMACFGSMPCTQQNEVLATVAKSTVAPWMLRSSLLESASVAAAVTTCYPMCPAGMIMQGLQTIQNEQLQDGSGQGL